MGPIDHTPSSSLFVPFSLLFSFPLPSSPIALPLPLMHTNTNMVSQSSLDCPSTHNPLPQPPSCWCALWNMGSESSHKRQSSDFCIFCVIQKYSTGPSHWGFGGGKGRSFWQMDSFPWMWLLSLLHILLGTMLKMDFCLVLLRMVTLLLLHIYIKATTPG